MTVAEPGIAGYDDGTAYAGQDELVGGHGQDAVGAVVGVATADTWRARSRAVATIDVAGAGDRPGCRSTPGP
ncbi:MAG: hypothetical protein ACRDZ4_01080 [Egibacteraceae bacterium]